MVDFDEQEQCHDRIERAYHRHEFHDEKSFREWFDETWGFAGRASNEQKKYIADPYAEQKWGEDVYIERPSKPLISWDENVGRFRDSKGRFAKKR